MSEKPDHREIIDCLLAAFPAASKVLLFGSRAHRGGEAASDYDILVVTVTELPPAKRAAKARMALAGLRAAFDLIVVTPEEFERLSRWKSSVVAAALRDGETLYEAA